MREQRSAAHAAVRAGPWLNTDTQDGANNAFLSTTHPIRPSQSFLIMRAYVIVEFVWADLRLNETTAQLAAAF